MRSIQTSLIAGIAAAAAMAVPASAADMPMVVKAAPVIVEQFSGWYLRGDIGMTNQRVKEIIDPVLFDSTVRVVDKGFDSSPLFGIGFGYQFNDWFRFDVTGEYRGGATFRGLDVWPGGTNDYTAIKSEWLFLGNAYVDLGTWWCVTPFIGAGVGFSRNTISNYRDVGIAPTNIPTLAYADSHSQWEFAWALHAGLAYKVSKNFTAEIAYRYVNLGDARTGDVITYLGQNSIYNPMYFNGITSHDIKLGLRWNLTPVDSVAPLAVSSGYVPPVYSPPPPAYTPPPPLMRKG